MNGFLPASERMRSEKREREGLVHRLLPFGINFLDKALRGILPQDLLLVGAVSGAGKTQLVNTIALAAARSGKQVHVFALEAENAEWERRMKYMLLVDRYFADLKARRDHHDYPKPIEYIKPNYLDWYLGDYDHIFSQYENDATTLQGLENLNIFYRSASNYQQFGINELRPELFNLQSHSDLIIIDHIHFFDFYSENENKEMAEIFKAIRDISLVINVPIIVVAHLRKLDKRLSKLVPDGDDFHGTSNLLKISTKSILLHPGGAKSTYQYFTYFNIAKSRIDGSRTKFLGRGVFNVQRNQYEDIFEIGTLSTDGKEFVPVTDEINLPDWIKGVRT